MAARIVLERNGLFCSESQILSAIAKLYLARWKGRGQKSATARRYNRKVSKRYVRMAWYCERELYATLWQRTLHSGQSVSRILDLAIRVYLPRLVETILSQRLGAHGVGSKNSSYWQTRYKLRRNPQPPVFVTYQCKTEINRHDILRYVQEYRLNAQNSNPPPEQKKQPNTAA
jgi:hypothetical protein